VPANSPTVRTKRRFKICHRESGRLPDAERLNLSLT
jgi:hypothetical protein